MHITTGQSPLAISHQARGTTVVLSRVSSKFPNFTPCGRQETVSAEFPMARRGAGERGVNPIVFQVALTALKQIRHVQRFKERSS